MIRLGIDPGTKDMGYSVFDENILIDYGLIELDNKKTIKEFIDDVEKELESIRLKHLINKIVIEKMFSSLNNSHLSLLNIMPRFINEYAISKNIDFKQIHNATIKKTISGDGKSSKEKISSIVCSYCHIDFDTLIDNYGKMKVYNVTDAISIALADIL